jgi:hypothetical protein
MMTILETTRCRDSGQPEFRVAVDGAAVIEPDIAFLLRTLEEWVQAGERFGDGETVQLGWCLLTVRVNEDNTLSLLEPDFRRMPILWVDSVTSTLRHLRAQKDVCESFFDPTAVCFPTLTQSCIVCTHLPEAQQLVMERHEPVAADSGWFLGCHGNTHDHNDARNLSRVSLYEAALQNPETIPYLALPPAVLLHVTADGLRGIFHEGKALQPKDGSYVDAIAKRRSTRT